MCYLDEHGNGRPTLTQARHHEDFELADAVANVCGGQVVEIIDQKDRKLVRTKNEPKKKEKKGARANQAWMRKGKING